MDKCTSITNNSKKKRLYFIIGDQASFNKYSRMNISVESSMLEDISKLLTLLGVPHFEVGIFSTAKKRRHRFKTYQIF